jgi:hypothetical protein
MAPQEALLPDGQIVVEVRQVDPNKLLPQIVETQPYGVPLGQGSIIRMRDFPHSSLEVQMDGTPFGQFTISRGPETHEADVVGGSNVAANGDEIKNFHGAEERVDIFGTVKIKVQPGESVVFTARSNKEEGRLPKEGSLAIKGGESRPDERKGPVVVLFWEPIKPRN